LIQYNVQLPAVSIRMREHKQQIKTDSYYEAYNSIRMNNMKAT